MANAKYYKEVAATALSLIKKKINKSAGYIQYVATNSGNSPDNKLSLSWAMLQRKVRNLSKSKTSRDRISHIKEESHHTHSGADVLLYIKDNYFAIQAIRWRINTFSLGLKCPICHHPFYYTHAEKCFGF
ncbi:hypothetical protein K7432_014649 [Basidiobolus ranarum]|uniref:Uncharacterized protein n=1 Tax=Basidiobolus ranarum TaxID=34480 RepID=A0ABR2VPA9_9FUNG